ncbi:CU044_2847 family protein [Streptomyces sp. NPDC055239]
MGNLARLPVEGGGSILFEASTMTEGPVKAGRIGDTIHELPRTVQEALHPVTAMARAALQQVQQAAPHEVVIEFGVDMTAEAGAVIAKSQAGCHLNVIVTWRAEHDDSVT